MDNSLDLTPFGFTPTETHVYAELLSGGPSSGYSIAKRLGIARANAYQALDGLAAKGAAHVTGERPRRYRATRPEALLAQVVDRQSRQLDRLEWQLAKNPERHTEDIVRIEGQRAIVDLAMRTAARQEGAVWCVGTADFLSRLAPAWRRRKSDGRETKAWVMGSEDVQSIGIQGEIVGADVDRLFKSEVFLLAGGDAVLAAQVGESKNKGIWSSEPTIIGAVKGAIVALTGLRTERWPEF